MLRTYKTCNSTIGFAKYKLHNKLLGGVILIKIKSSVTWTQPYIYIYIYREREREREREVQVTPSVTL